MCNTFRNSETTDRLVTPKLLFIAVILVGSIMECKFRPIPLTLIAPNRLFARIYGLFRLSNECSSGVSQNLTRIRRRCYLLFTTNNKTAASACLSTNEFIDSLPEHFHVIY